MLCAGAATTNELFAKSRTRAMGADCCIGRRNARGVSVAGQRNFSEINLAQQLPVVWGDRVKRLIDAEARYLVKQRVGAHFCLQLANPALERFALDSVPPVVVDDRIAKNAIEPSHGRTIITQLVGGFEHADEGALEDVLGRCRVVDAALHKAKELPAQGDQRVEGGL